MDIIRPFGRSLYLQFSSTGESRSASTLQLDQGVTVSKEGSSLLGRYHRGESSFIIERFASEQLATSALRSVETAMFRFAKRQRVTGAAKGFVLWIVTPFIGAMFALGFNATAGRTATMQSAAMNRDAGYASASHEGSMAPPAAAPSAAKPTQPPLAEVAKGMGNAVKAGKFSVQVSSGSKGTIYVFSDPACPHCRDFERHIDVLAKTYTIHIFPVSVVGGPASSTRNAQLLCSTPKARPEAWKKLINSAAQSDTPGCVEGQAAGEANDKIFRVLGLPGTPSLVAADGRIMPDTMSLKAEAVDAWMQSRSAR